MSHPSYEPGAGRSKRWIIALALAVVGVGLLTLWWVTRTQPESAAPAPTPAPEIAPPPSRPAPDALVLPPLDESDTLMRDLVSTLSTNPSLARVLASKRLVRSSVLTVVQIADGHTPTDTLGMLRPSSRLSMMGGSEQGRIDTSTYQRWDSAVQSLTSVDPVEAAQLYVNLKPLFDQAYADLGYPGGNFDDAIARSIEVLLATPDPIPEPDLLRRPAYFEYADPEFRSLKPVQKQFLLMGPDNRFRARAWLARFASALDLNVRRPPPPAR